MVFFHHRCLYPFVDYVLTRKEKKDSLDELLQDKCLFLSDSLEEKLSTAKILYIHPDTFDLWAEQLVFLNLTTSVQLVLFADSDMQFRYDQLEVFFRLFPTAQFWIQNWIDFHPRAMLLPLGVSDILPSVVKTKESLLGISFLHHYIGCKPRDDFFSFLHSHPEVLPFCFPKVPFKDYCHLLAKCSYHTCVMGEGPDTFRFWESLALNCIPIVIDDEFYTCLEQQYPGIPMLRLKKWDDLFTIPIDVDVNVDVNAIFVPELPYLYEDYWVAKIKEFKE